MSAAAKLAPSESDFQRAVIDMAHIFGWRVAHFRPARTTKGWRTAVGADGAGFPDLVLAHRYGGGILYRELKTDSGRVAAEQAEWIIWINDAGGDAGIWRPKDWKRIEEELRVRRHRV